MRLSLLITLLLFGTLVTARSEPPLLSKVYHLPRGMFERLPAGAKLELTTLDIAGVPVRAFDISPWLEYQGMQLPSGHKAVYVEELDAAILLTSQDNLDVADTLLLGCCGLPSWPLMSQLTLVSFDQGREPLPPSVDYEELKKRAGDSWKVISVLEISSKLGKTASGVVVQKR